MLRLRRIYSDPGYGIPKDDKQAKAYETRVAKHLAWFKTRADKGEAEGQSYLGWCYSEGTGVPQDAQEAVRWCRVAAEQGNAQAQFDLGGCYRDGLGVATDPAKALYWFELAVKQGSKWAQGQLNALRSQYPRLLARPPSPLVGAQQRFLSPPDNEQGQPKSVSADQLTTTTTYGKGS